MLSNFKVTIFQPELRKCTLRTTVVLKSCDFPTGAAKVFFAYFGTEKLRYSSRSCGIVLRVQLSCLKVAIFQQELRKCTSRSKVAPELRQFTSRTTFVLKSYDFPAGAAKVYFAYYFHS